MENLIKSLKSLAKAFWKVLYPPICVHCGAFLDRGKILCFACQSLLEVIEHQQRCLYCFSSEKRQGVKICKQCLNQPQALSRFGAVFDHAGPAYELMRQFRTGKSYLSESLGAYLFFQWSQFEWEAPDLIVPVPGAFSRWLQRGYHPSALLAKQMSRFLGRKTVNALKRGSYQMEEARFFLRKRMDLRDKIVLLIDDWYHSGRTMDKAAEALREGAPAKIYGMTVTRRLE